MPPFLSRTSDFGVPPASADAGAVAGLILASGMSTRFGPGNKLLARIGGRALVERVATTYIAAGLDPVIVVVGFEASLVSAELACSPVVIVPNPNFGAGQSRALVRGVRNLPASAPAAVIGVADQPFLTPRVIEALIEAYRARAPRIVAPLFSGRRGNPVLFDRSLFGVRMVTVERSHFPRSATFQIIGRRQIAFFV